MSNDGLNSYYDPILITSNKFLSKSKFGPIGKHLKLKLKSNTQLKLKPQKKVYIPRGEITKICYFSDPDKFERYLRILRKKNQISKLNDNIEFIKSNIKLYNINLSEEEIQKVVNPLQREINRITANIWKTERIPSDYCSHRDSNGAQTLYFGECVMCGKKNIPYDTIYEYDLFNGKTILF